MKSLVTGGFEGFGAELCTHLGAGSLGISRQTGHNIGVAEHRQKIVQLSLDFDVFVNFAHRDFMQTQLLYEVADAWTAAKKKGHIFNIGSYSTFMVPDKFQRWIVSKFSLDLANRQYCKKIDSGELPFKMTLIRLGFLDTEKSRSKPHWTGIGHRPADVAEALKRIYSWPDAMNIHEMTVHCPAPN